MVIRQSTPEDLPEILRLIAAARAFMTEHGNPSQWPEGYPSAEQLSSDIAAPFTLLSKRSQAISISKDDGSMITLMASSIA